MLSITRKSRTQFFTDLPRPVNNTFSLAPTFAIS